MLTVELELACNGGLREGISFDTDAFHNILPHGLYLQASPSSTIRIQICSID